MRKLAAGLPTVDSGNACKRCQVPPPVSCARPEATGRWPSIAIQGFSSPSQMLFAQTKKPVFAAMHGKAYSLWILPARGSAVDLAAVFPSPAFYCSQGGVVLKDYAATPRADCVKLHVLRQVHCIASLSTTLSTPAFRPHLTLVGDIQPPSGACDVESSICSAVQEAAAEEGISSFSLRLKPGASPMVIRVPVAIISLCPALSPALHPFALHYVRHHIPLPCTKSGLCLMLQAPLTVLLPSPLEDSPLLSSTMSCKCQDQGTNVWSMSVLQWAETMGDEMKRLREAIVDKLVKNLGMQVETRAFRPHMSLVYGEIPYQVRVELAAQVTVDILNKVKSHEFKLDVSSIMLIETPVPAGPAGIPLWREVADIPLSKA